MGNGGSSSNGIARVTLSKQTLVPIAALIAACTLVASLTAIWVERGGELTHNAEQIQELRLEIAALKTQLAASDLEIQSLSKEVYILEQKQVNDRAWIRQLQEHHK